MERETITEVVGEFIDPKEKLHSRETTDETTLTAISEFYKENRAEINTLAKQTHTIDIFSTAKDPRTPLKYTKAKIIDMYGFQIGKLYSNK